MLDLPVSRRAFLGGAAAVGLAVTGSTLLPVTAAHAAGPDLACWGDSLTYGVGGAGVTYPDELSKLLKLKVYNGGVIGERTSGISARQGGRVPVATFPTPSEPLPAGTFKVFLDSKQPFYAKTQVVQEEGTLDCTIGSVRGVLAKRDYSWEFNPYYFTRADGANVLPPAGQLRFDVSTEQYAPTQIFWGGHNDLRLIYGPTPSDRDRGDVFREIVYDNTRLMTDAASATQQPDRYLVLSMLNGKFAGNGSTTTGKPTDYYKNVVLLVNPQLAAEHGPQHYLDVRTWLVNDALAYGGITPTAQDEKDLREDIPPSSLTVRGQDPHLNSVGYTLLARYLAENLVRLGWY
ncbi:MAG: hypothetical protein H0T85_09545 [Geodermatophilaceae bacterium]|nr:hypothetical protein [Geodermatophilaceae bacterium]